MNNDNLAESCCGSGRLWVAVAIFLLALLVAAEWAQAWTAWQKESGQFDQIGAVLGHGSLCAVTLVSGQVYYGTLVEAKNNYLRLSHIYYVQNVLPPNGGPMQFRLVNRHKNDWHSPDWMAIPTDKILFVEDVGVTSRFSLLISQDQASPQAVH
ncbi:MAG: hypothetical protein ACYCSS_00575 [Sulfuriferula sp.]